MLTERQRRLILALVSSATIRAACRKARVAERTYRRWRDVPEFKTALDAARQEAFSEGIGILKAALPRGSRVLVRCFKAKDAADVIRAVKVAYDVVKAADMDDMRQRVEAMEAALQGRQHG
jgi:hypothetical protein